MSDDKQQKAQPKAQAPATSKEPQQESSAVVEVPQVVSTPPANAFPVSILLVLGLAMLVSYAIFRFAQLRIAERVKRWAPFGHVFIWLTALLACGTIAIRRSSTEWMIFGAFMVGLGLLLNLNWLRSIFAGVTLTLEHHLEIGDSVRIGDLEGDIIHFGLRATRIRAVDGTLHDIPNVQLLTEEIANLSGDGSDSACRIQVTAPDHLSIEEARAMALQAALLSPMASPRHRPEIFLNEPLHGELTPDILIRGYAFDPNYQDHFRSDVLKRLTRLFEESAPQET